MSKHDEGRGGYVDKVRDVTRRYTEELLHEIEKLQSLASSLEDDNDRLRIRLEAVREELERHERERARMREQLGAVESETRSFADRYVEVEQQNANLANL